MTETQTPYHNYRLSRGHFQSGTDAKSITRREVYRLDIESDKQYAQRIEMLIRGLQERGREDFDDPSFRVIVIHGKEMATITVEVVHGEPRLLPPDSPDQGDQSPADGTNGSGGD